jgi:hypothetical protein
MTGGQPADERELALRAIDVLDAQVAEYVLAHA